MWHPFVKYSILVCNIAVTGIFIPYLYRMQDFTFTLQFHALEKEMATHSSVLAWRIPGRGNLVVCHLLGCRVRYDWSDAAEAAAQDAALSTRIQCWYKDFTFILTFKNCIYVFFGCTGALFLHRLFSSCGQKGYSLLIVVVHGILISRSTWSTGSRVQTLWLRHMGPAVVVNGLSCSEACGIFPDQGLNPCPLHWQGHSSPTSHQGSPCLLLWRPLVSVVIFRSTTFPSLVQWGCSKHWQWF